MCSMLGFSDVIKGGLYIDADVRGGVEAAYADTALGLLLNSTIREGWSCRRDGRESPG